MVLAAVLGMIAVGAASADQAQPIPAAGPAPAPTFVQAPVAAPTFVQGGCCTAASDCCGKDRKRGLLDRHCHGNGRCAGLTIGAGCANTVSCGNWATHRTFVFGSCNQFFNPGDKCGHGGLFGRAHCATAPLGTGIVPPGPCCYGSYLNR
jgi:hypothetical protein